MTAPNLQSLLAPTWPERARAEDALFLWLLQRGYSPGHLKALPDELPPVIEALSPSPAVFLPALVAFWADVTLQQVQDHSYGRTQPLPPCDPTRWASPHSAQFPMTPPTPPGTAIQNRGFTVWYLIDLMHPWAELMKEPLVGCLQHPRAVHTAKRVLGALQHFDDALYRAFLVAIDRDGTSETCPALAAVTRHSHPHRLPWLMDGLALRPADQVIAARFAVLGALPRQQTAPLYSRMLSHLRGMMKSDAFGIAISALYGDGNGPNEPEFIDMLLDAYRAALFDHRGAAIFALTALDPCRFESMVLDALTERDTWLMLDVMWGLRVYVGVLNEDQHLFRQIPLPSPAPGACAKVPDQLLRQLAHHALGCNFFYGEPCTGMLELLAVLDNARVALPELSLWLHTETMIEDKWLKALESVMQHLGDDATPLRNEVARLQAALNDPTLGAAIDIGPPTAAQAEWRAQAEDMMESIDSKVELRLIELEAERAEYNELYGDQAENPFAPARNPSR